MSLTPKQHDFLTRLGLFIRREGRPPTIREMKDQFRPGGFGSTRTVIQYLNALEKAGYIKRGKGARNVRIVKHPPAKDAGDRAETTTVPLVGTVSAGLPLLAEENIEGEIRVQKNLIKETNTYFALRVKGDSMNLAGIRSGDYVLVKQQPTAQDGDIVVALIDDEAMIKRIRFLPKAIVLQPESTNRSLKPVVMEKDFLIQGVVLTPIPREKA